MTKHACAMCGSNVPYTDHGVCESCAPLDWIGNERQWEAARRAVARAVAEERERFRRILDDVAALSGPTDEADHVWRGAIQCVREVLENRGRALAPGGKEGA